MGSSSPKRSQDSAFRQVGDEGGLVVLPSRSEVKVLNPVGSLVYGLLDGQHTRQQIVEAVIAEFEVTPEQAAHDVDLFLEDLEAQGMLTRPEAGNPSQEQG